MMGLLSRKKTQSSQPAQLPPPISAPLPSSHPPSISTSDYSSSKKSASGGAYAAQQQPSPPRSPVEAGYAHHAKQQSQSYRPQSSNSQNRAGGYGGGQDYGYGANGSAAGGYQQERGYGDVEGKMGNLGINGGNGSGAAGSADQMSVDTDMADGSNGQGQYGANGGYQQQQSAVSRHHPQQQASGGGGHHHSHASRQLARQTETTPQVVLSPTPSQSSSVSRKTSSRYSLTDFTFIRTLGTGSFGRVHLVRSQHNGRSYAIKVLGKERVVKMKQVEHTNSEREMLERVRHPFLVNLWGTFKDSKNLYMVMDFVAGGELFSLLRKSQRFPDPVAKFFAAEVALALDYLHSLDIIYRDLKPENILLGADGHVKITDFGFAKHVPDITWTLCGTPDYLAPEIVQSRGYNKSVDWYALGVLMFEMLAGYPPFFTEDSNPMRLYEKIISGKIRYPAYFTPEAKDLLKSLLTTDITKRFGNLANGSRDIFGHVWFQEVDWERLYRKEIPAPYVPKVEGDWDASNFDAYPEVDLSEYGSSGPDPHGHLFPLF